MFNLIQPSGLPMIAPNTTTTTNSKRPTFLANHTSFNAQFSNFSQQASIPSVAYNQHHQYQFQQNKFMFLSNQTSTDTFSYAVQPTSSGATAGVVSSTSSSSLSSSNSIVSPSKLAQNESDDHFNRHMENLTKNDDENPSLIIEDDQEELNETNLNKLISKSSRKEAKNSGDDNSEDYFSPPIDEQPKVFQDEDVLNESSEKSAPLAKPSKVLGERIG